MGRDTCSSDCVFHRSARHHFYATANHGRQDGRGESPFGSIVVHAADGITQIFDRDWDQLLSISVEKSCTDCINSRTTQGCIIAEIRPSSLMLPEN